MRLSEKLSERDIKRIGECAEENSGRDCGFRLGRLCQFCSVWIKRNIPRCCAWVRKNDKK